MRLSLAFFFFAALASCLMAFSHRYLKKLPFLWARSQCDQCQVTLSALALIPLAGYFLSRGRCFHCQHPIAWTYPLFEGLFALLSLLILARFSTGQAAYLVTLHSLLFIMAMTDLEEMWVPDRFQVLFFLSLLAYHGLYTPTSHYPSLLIHLLATGLVLGLLVYLLPGSLGGADIKIFLSLALFFPPRLYPRFICLASGLALTYLLISSWLKQRSLKAPLAFFPLIWLAFDLTIIFFY
ncbi:prepilin peptidase [Aerococcus tenax]|uniref:prepilin peptidase n=1 Tax=Aerococcus tenax TaxID=3078812 RepID=UPI0018A7554D|nr:A24 family peptidase [Aerococcus tenax]